MALVGQWPCQQQRQDCPHGPLCRKQMDAPHRIYELP